MGGGDADRPAPPPEGEVKLDPANFGRTAYGELRGELQSIYQGPSSQVEQFRDDTTKLEKAAWYNWSLNDSIPPYISSSVDDNRRLWQDLHFETMLDHQPAHEVHAKDLPEYHFFPSIQNEVKPLAFDLELQHSQLMGEYHDTDQTHMPRFQKSGVPKTPPQQQDFFLPLKADGRFDWRKNIELNGYTASLFSKRGWDRRYFASISKPNMILHFSGVRSFAQHPIWFRHFELPLAKRIWRQMHASHFDRLVLVGAFYVGFLASIAAGGSTFKLLQWDSESWNYDFAFTRFNRDKGGFHGVV